jgi:DNA-binding NtrC family response regulator
VSAADPRPAALIVEDDADFRDSLARLVDREGFAAHQASSLADAIESLNGLRFNVVLVDLSLPDGDGLSLLESDLPGPAPEFIVITGNASVDSAVEALRRGALDYLTKPLDRGRLKSVLTNVARTRALKSELAELRGELRGMGRFGRLVGRSAALQKVYDLITRVAPTEASVFIVGASGTGKELVAETIHGMSRRKTKPFLAVNCGALSASVIESELFGHEKGSFTGADRMRQGYFESVEGGTLFLDEITEMPVELQVKLLRVLETGALVRVGASKSTAIDVRVLAATNRDPAQAVRDGKLREDLYYRLNVFPIALPLLRERKGDAELLANHFVAEVNARDGAGKKLSAEALHAIREHEWPGNVRELKNAVERAAIMAADVITPEHLSLDERPVGPAANTDAGDASGRLSLTVGSTLADAERKLLLATLHAVGGDKKRAADILGISVKTIYNRLNVYEAAGHDVEVPSEKR